MAAESQSRKLNSVWQELPNWSCQGVGVLIIVSFLISDDDMLVDFRAATLSLVTLLQMHEQSAPQLIF